jgi:hypothetical protein
LCIMNSLLKVRQLIKMLLLRSWDVRVMWLGESKKLAPPSLQCACSHSVAN